MCIDTGTNLQMLTQKDIDKITQEMPTFDENKRRQTIIDYIENNQGCTAEDIIRGQTLSGRGKTFRILKDLKKKRIIRVETSDTNRRNKRLFLDENNPLISFPKEVNQFKECLFDLFEKARLFRQWNYKYEIYCPSDELLGECFSLFFEYLNINNYRAFVIWPNTIKDKETLGKLYTLFYSEMIKLNLELREKFQPVEFGLAARKRKLLARGMDRAEYLTIAKNAALGAMDIFPDSLHIEKTQSTFYDHKLDNASRPVVQFLADLRENIYYSQSSQSERDSILEFREEQRANEEFEEQRQKELRELAKKLRIIERERKRDRSNPYPRCDCDYGSIYKEYDPLIGKKKLQRSPPDISRFMWPEKYAKH
jgi:hypothetical protein